MKSFDEWFSEQGSSQEEPQAEKQCEQEAASQHPLTYQEALSIYDPKKAIGGITADRMREILSAEHNPLFEQIIQREQERREKELESQILAEPQMEVQTIKRPGKPDLYVPIYKAAAPIKDSFKEAFPDYDEVWHNNIRFIRVGDMITWTDEKWGPQKSTLKTMNALHEQYPNLYPRFEQ